MSYAKSKDNQKKAKIFANQIIQKIQQLIAEHNDKIQILNKDIIKNDKTQKISNKKDENGLQATFYEYADDAASKLLLMNKKLSSSQKIKKDLKPIFQNKIGLLVEYIKQVVQGSKVRIIIDQWLIKWIQQMGQLAQQVMTSLGLLEKQSKGFCFGGDDTTLKIVQKSLFDLIGYTQFWQVIHKFNPLVEKHLQMKYIQLDYEENIIVFSKLILPLWPQAQIVQVEIEKIVEKVIIKQIQKQINSDETIKSQMQVNEIKQMKQKNEKLIKQLQNEKILRQAHQYLIGLGRSQNISKAIQIYNKIPSINNQQHSQESNDLKINSLICNILGCLYEQGKYISRDLNKACQYYIKSASAQDPQGLYKIAKFLEKRMVNPVELFEQGYQNRGQQIKDAIQHYQKAAQKGHLDAITDLGHIYQNGIKRQSQRSQHSAVSQSQVSNSKAQDYIIQPNLQHAAKYYLLAKKQQFPRALNNLGAMYIRMGDKLSETMKGSNIERGIKYLKRATQLKYGKAFLNLGKCYEKGLGVKKNYDKAKSLYIEGAQLEDNQCKLEFIKCMINNEIQIQGKIDIKIHEYLRQILINEPQMAQALYLMGVFQQKGIGVQKNPQSAYYYIHKAAKLDHSISLVKLGDYYYSGFHVAKDIPKAKMCYEKAAAKGNSQGFINLGLLYQKGFVDLGNKAEERQVAINYFLEAAKLGNPNALLFLNKEGADPEQVKQAAELGSPQALKILAKTNTTAEVENKSFQKSISKYKNLVNRFISEANRLPQASFKRQQKKMEPPASPRLRQMMIYSPRQRPHAASNVFSPRFANSHARQAYRSQEYLRR